MTAITNDAVKDLRERFGRTLASRLPPHIGRLGWDAQQLAAHQTEQLRALLAIAHERSPFHARRLAGIDPARFELSQLAELPGVTKQQMMAGFDELPNDRRGARAGAGEDVGA